MFFLPTTIAPRYGDPENVGIQPHQTPEYDLTADNPFIEKRDYNASKCRQDIGTKKGKN